MYFIPQHSSTTKKAKKPSTQPRRQQKPDSVPRKAGNKYYQTLVKKLKKQVVARRRYAEKLKAQQKEREKIIQQIPKEVLHSVISLCNAESHDERASFLMNQVIVKSLIVIFIPANDCFVDQKFQLT